MSMDSITVVNSSMAALRQHLPELDDPSAKTLYDTIGAALHRQGEAYLLHDVAGNESEIKRVLRLAVRDEPQLGASLGQASAAVRSRAPTDSIGPAAGPPPAQAAPASTLRRQDLAAAVDATPGPMRHQIFNAAARCVSLIDASLPEDEEVHVVSIASFRPGDTENCLLVLTGRRLIFVTPTPQVIAYRLATLTRSQAFNGYYFLEGDAGEHSLGLPDGKWSRQFEQRVYDAAALAVLADW